MTISQYLVPTVSAAAAMVPTYYGFAVKSAQQLDKTIPRFVPLEAIKNGLKLAPTAGLIVGTQMIAEKWIGKQLGAENSLLKSLASAAIVGLISAPLLAAFNGQTMGRSISESILALSMREAAAITAKETIFVVSLGASSKVSQIMKRYFGDNMATEYAGAFVSGAIGSIVGHPFDTMLTRWQAGLPCKAIHLMKGATAKALAVGSFSMFYNMGKGFLTSSLVKT
ncbi:MAG: hypothetical protein K940chlam6_00093 [Chlamydiae bacterium]|nr:hypothetical protein [Chlamydiota bacterium]